MERGPHGGSDGGLAGATGPDAAAVVREVFAAAWLLVSVVDQQHARVPREVLEAKDELRVKLDRLDTVRMGQ